MGSTGGLTRTELVEDYRFECKKISVVGIPILEFKTRGAANVKGLHFPQFVMK